MKLFYIAPAELKERISSHEKTLDRKIKSVWMPFLKYQFDQIIK